MLTNKSTSPHTDHHAAIGIILAVSETIREAGETPAGPLYAALMAKGIDMQGWQAIIGTLKGAKLIEETNGGQILRWIGPLKGVTR